MTAEARGRLNAWISGKRGEWAVVSGCSNCANPYHGQVLCGFAGCGCKGGTATSRPCDWSGDWRYAGKLLEELKPDHDVELLIRETHARVFIEPTSVRHDIPTVTVDAVGDTLTEAIALAWARLHGLDSAAEEGR